ncbi:MAG: hypothetical protein E7333_04925 [Clostridiales bacterium]|nr:hypothetical protein [Clostridiales bacterium]
MVIRNEHEALCVAVEMERRAIRVYERALMLTKDEQVIAALKEILAQEQEHFARFSAMQREFPCDAATEQMLLQAMGADVLFQGGVMDMARKDALSSVKGLYAYAADSEQQAVETYLKYADLCQNANVADVFRAIAAEEAMHHGELLRQV